MKKQLFLITLLAVGCNYSVASEKEDFEEYKRLGAVARPRRSEEQKAQHLANKETDQNFQRETPEFRFAIKLEQYHRMFLEKRITLLDFILEISRKVENYLKLKKEHIHNKETQKEIVNFLNKCLSMSLEELQEYMGEKDEDIIQRTMLNRMQRFVNELE